MGGKYFTATVKPEIAASLQTGAFGAGDVLCDWTAFDVPKGANRLIGVTAIIRGTDGAAHATARDLELYFAKSTNGGITAPPSLGTINATADGVGFYNHIIGSAKIDNTAGADWKLLLDTLSVATTGFGAGATQAAFGVLQGEPESGTNVGYDKLYLGVITAGALNFSTEVDIGPSAGVDISGSDGTFDVIDGTDPRLCFAPGDVLHAQDDIIVGEIASLDANNITFKFSGEATASGTSYTVPATLAAWRIQNGAGTAGDLLENDELYNINPVTFILSFER